MGFFNIYIHRWLHLQRIQKTMGPKLGTEIVTDKRCGHMKAEKELQD